MYMFTLPSNVNDLPADVAAPPPGKSFTWTLFFMFIHHGNATIYGHPPPPPLYTLTRAGWAELSPMASK